MQPKVVLKKAERTVPAGIEGTTVLLATCAGGMEQLLERELASLHHPVVERRRGALYFRGTLADLLPLNRALRTASRLLLPLTEVRTQDYTALYRALLEIPWEEIVPVDATFAISASSRSRELRDHRFLAMRVKDAIVDRQRDRRNGRRASVDRDTPQLMIVVHAESTGVSLSLDASGEPLHERGYRTEAGEAPLRETLAAAMVMTALEGTGVRAIVDPFCGSGTIPIEAALIVSGRLPGELGRRYACSRWPWLRRSASTPTSHPEKDSGSTGGMPRIIASDRDAAMVELARRNARRAGVEALITFAVSPAAELPVLLERELGRDYDGSLTRVVTNPPWGERLQPDDLEEIFRDFGTALRGISSPAWVLCTENAPVDRLGIQPRHRTPLYNGGLKCSLLEVDPG